MRRRTTTRGIGHRLRIYTVRVGPMGMTEGRQVILRGSRSPLVIFEHQGRQVVREWIGARENESTSD